MSSSLRWLPALAAAAAVTLVASACGGGHSKRSTTASSTATVTKTTTGPGTVSGRRTTVVLYPSMTATLKQEGVTVTAVAPARGSGSVLSFPISGGHMVRATFAGTLSHAGGLTLSHHDKSVTLTDFVITTHSKQLTAKLGGSTVPIFALDLGSLRRANEPKQTMVATGIKLKVASNAASALNSGLGITAFKGGQDFGVATLVIAVS